MPPSRVFLRLFVLASLVLAAVSCRSPAPRSLWSDTVWMENAHWQVGVSPSAGRIVHLSASGKPNVLRVHGENANQTEPPSGRWDWLDYGGDWLWPVAQEDWIHLGITYSWPPPNTFEYQPWAVTRGEEKGPWLRMELRVGEPLHILIRRKIHLPDQEPGQLRIGQSIERLAPSEIPVCLWQVAQVHPDSAVRMERRDDSSFSDGYHIITGKDFSSQTLRTEKGQVVFTCGVDAGKIGTDGQWIEGHGLRIEVRNPNGGLGLPDGGCSVVLAHHPDKPYAEIETMSPRWDLQVGERVSNLLLYRLTQPLRKIP